MSNNYMKYILNITIFIVLLFFLLPACAADKDDRLLIYTVNYPLAYFAERIGGTHVQVEFPVPADVDPAFWRPDADEVSAYQQADLILLNGADYAKWISKVSLPRFRLVNTSKAFESDYIQVESAIAHSHGTGDAHSHAGIAFTTWLDLTLADKQAQAILSAMLRKRPDLSDEFKRNYEALNKELLSLDKKLQSIVAGNNKAVLASHPVYQYMARRYGMNLHSVMWEPDVVPDQDQLEELGRLSKKYSAHWMIWEGKPSNESIVLLKERGIQSVVFSPLGNKADSGDFVSHMEANILNLRRVFSTQ
jgi:zinc transport system substrate-binding protein